MKILSIRQPWASLIINGTKDIENRTWQTSYRGPLLIHAAKIIDPTIREIRRLLRSRDIMIPDFLPTGGIIGYAELQDCVIHHRSPWFTGPYGFVVTHQQSLPFLPCPGQLGLYAVHEEIWRAIEEELASPNLGDIHLSDTAEQSPQLSLFAE